jgi:hypothetical protein
MTVFRFYLSTGRLREGGDHENRPKRRQTRCLGLSYVFFFHFFLVLLLLTTVLGTIYLREGLGKAAMTKTGPNDAFGVVWAIRKLFFLCCCYLLSNSLELNYMYNSRTTENGHATSTLETATNGDDSGGRGSRRASLEPLGLFYYSLPTASGKFFSIYFIVYYTNEYLKIDYPGMEMTRGGR